MITPPNLAAPFNTALWQMRQVRAAKITPRVDFLQVLARERVVERLSDITRDFPAIAEIGARDAILAEALHPVKPWEQYRLLSAWEPESSLPEGVHWQKMDAEILSLEPESCDAILSVLGWHVANDVPGLMMQAFRALKPDGLLLAVFAGGRTLQELRQVMQAVELEQCGGVSPRVHPMIDVRDAGSLLQRSGFNLPIIDSELLTITYPDAFALMQELRAMGESNCLHQQNPATLPRHFFPEVAARYQAEFGDADGRIPATVELITVAGWKPHASQPKAAPRGSGTVSLGDILSG